MIADNLNEVKIEKDVLNNFVVSVETDIVDVDLDENDELIVVESKETQIIDLSGIVLTPELTLAIGKCDLSDYGNAVAFCLLFGDKFKYNDNFGLLFYDGKRWNSTRLAEIAMQQAIIHTFNTRITISGSKAEIHKVCRLSAGNIGNCKTLALKQPQLLSEPDDFDKYNYLMNVNNGIINLKTGELLPHNPKYFLTTVSSVDYNLNADYTDFETFLATVIGDYDKEEIATYLKLALGYCTTGETKEECMFYGYGKLGRNGKGTLALILTKVWGSLSVARSFSTFTKKRNNDDQGFDLAGLRIKRAVIASESDAFTSLNTAIVKSITGNDDIVCAFKGKDTFTFSPRFKILLFSNHPPKPDDIDDNAFWARLRLITFPHSFIGNENKNLKAQMTSKNMLEGVLKYLVEGAKAYYKTGSKGLKTPQILIDRLNDEKELLDTVAQWIKETWVKDESTKENYIRQTCVYRAYVAWCDSNDLSYVKKPRLFKSLDAKKIVAEQTRVVTCVINNHNHVTNRIEHNEKFYVGYKYTGEQDVFDSKDINVTTKLKIDN